jgi:predicted small integral membrane protein
MVAVLEWMVWTSGTVIFAIAVFVGLLAITALAIAFPSAPRKGFLPIRTARGDRIYISLLTTGLVMVLWIIMTDRPLMVGLAVAVVVVSPIVRWG